MYEFYETTGCISDNGTELIYTSIFFDDNRWNGSPHIHDFWEIFFCLGGSCEFFIWDDSFIAQPGDFVVINPGVEHWENNLGNKWIVVAFAGTQPAFENTAAGYTKGSYIRKSEYITQLAMSIVDEAKNKLPGYQKACMNMLDLLLLQIQRIKEADTYQVSIVPELRQEEAKYYSITWIKQYIENNYTHNLNIEFLSRKIGLNKYSLIREFKQAYDVSPIEYLLRCRFREAKFLLSTTNLSISHIGQGVGFSSSNYFSQCFMKREGMSPTAYRQLHQKNKQRDEAERFSPFP